MRNHSPNIETNTNVKAVPVTRHYEGECSPKQNVVEYVPSDSTPVVNTDIHEQSRVLSDSHYNERVPSPDRHGDDSLQQSSIKETHNLMNSANNQYSSPSSPDNKSRQFEKLDKLSNEPPKLASVPSDDFVDNTGADKLQVVHTRQPSQEELECEDKAKELVKVLPESDKSLTNALKPENKGRMDYMNNLFADSLSISRESLGSRHSPSSSISKEQSQEGEDTKSDDCTAIHK